MFVCVCTLCVWCVWALACFARCFFFFARAWKVTVNEDSIRADDKKCKESSNCDPGGTRSSVGRMVRAVHTDASP